MSSSISDQVLPRIWYLTLPSDNKSNIINFVISMVRTEGEGEDISVLYFVSGGNFFTRDHFGDRRDKQGNRTDHREKWNRDLEELLFFHYSAVQLGFFLTEFSLVQEHLRQGEEGLLARREDSTEAESVQTGRRHSRGHDGRRHGQGDGSRGGAGRHGVGGHRRDALLLLLSLVY